MARCGQDGSLLVFSASPCVISESWRPGGLMNSSKEAPTAGTDGTGSEKKGQILLKYLLCVKSCVRSFMQTI